MPTPFGTALLGEAAQTAGNAVSTGMGLLLEKHNDRRQLRQQEKLQNLQLQGNKEMALFNYDQQMKMWNDTNYKAQMEQLHKAGLNPSLIYGMNGGGGQTTQAAQAQGATGAHAPTGGGRSNGVINAKDAIGTNGRTKKKHRSRYSK